jgi:hypothetical protein
MSSISRRIFLQSAFASSVALAAERIGNSSWVLSSADRIRVAIVGLRNSAYEHLGIFASIPAAEIVTLYDPDMNRLRKAASFLCDRGYPQPRLTTQLSRVVSDSSIEAISLACQFPSCLAPLSSLLASKKPLLFDSPSVNSFEDALVTNRKIAISGSVIRSRLIDHLAPDSRHLRPNSPALRRIGVPSQACLTSALPKNDVPHLNSPAVACIDLLMASSVRQNDGLADPILANPKVSSRLGSTVIEFAVEDSFLRRIRIDTFASRSAPGAVLHLQGRSGQLTCHASIRASRDRSVSTFIEFLKAVRGSPVDGNSAAQRAYFATGLARLIMSSPVQQRTCG